MVINDAIVQYNCGFLPYIFVLTQAPVFVWFDGTIIVYIITDLLTVYYSIFCFFMLGGSAWWLI